jgi:hypothetical protein
MWSWPGRQSGTAFSLTYAFEHSHKRGREGYSKVLKQKSLEAGEQLRDGETLGTKRSPA